MTRAFHAWIYPVLSLAVGLAGLGFMLWLGERAVPFLEFLLGPPHANSSSFPVWGAPALLAGIFGFLRPRPKEIWSYGFLMWTPQAIVGVVVAISSGWFSGLGPMLLASSLLAAVVGVVASYLGFALRRGISRGTEGKPEHV